MAAIVSDRLTHLTYQQARRLIIPTGLVVLAVVTAVMYARRVDTVEVLGTLLFAPIFLGFVFKGVAGGIAMAFVAVACYIALRYPAIEAVGVSEFIGLILSRGAAYLVFGVVGGWSDQVLEGSLKKLELYDEIDDETGLFNARYLLHQIDLEMARARRYRTIFSLVAFTFPAAPLHGLRGRQRRALLKDLGRQLGGSVRTVDHVVHVHEGGLHRIVAILPETASEGAAVFAGRFERVIRNFLSERGVRLDEASITPARVVTFPGDDAAIEDVRVEFTRIDAGQHR